MEEQVPNLPYWQLNVLLLQVMWGADIEWGLRYEIGEPEIGRVRNHAPTANCTGFLESGTGPNDKEKGLPGGNSFSWSTVVFRFS